MKLRYSHYIFALHTLIAAGKTSLALWHLFHAYFSVLF